MKKKIFCIILIIILIGSIGIIFLLISYIKEQEEEIQALEEKTSVLLTVEDQNKDTKENFEKILKDCGFDQKVIDILANTSDTNDPRYSKLYTLSAKDNKIIDIINKKREEQGLEKLILDESLTKIATIYTLQIVFHPDFDIENSKNFFTNIMFYYNLHEPFDLMGLYVKKNSTTTDETLANALFSMEGASSSLLDKDMKKIGIGDSRKFNLQEDYEKDQINIIVSE